MNQYQNQGQGNQGQGGNNFNRNSDFNRNPFRKPFIPSTRAYHAEGQENTPSHDEQEDYNRYEDAFYQGASWATEAHSTEASNDQSDEAFNEQSFTEDQDPDSVEAHFATPPVTKHKCRNCEKPFASNNLLHKHLSECRKATAAGKNEIRLRHIKDNEFRRNIAEELGKKRRNLAKEPTKSDNNVEAFSIQIIESSATDKPTPGRAFRGYRFTTVKVSLTY